MSMKTQMKPLPNPNHKPGTHGCDPLQNVKPVDFFMQRDALIVGLGLAVELQKQKEQKRRNRKRTNRARI